MMNTNANAAVTPRIWAPSWWNEPVYTRPGLPTALRSARRGEVKMPHDSVPQMPATPCADSAPTGSSSLRSIASTQSTTITPATAPMIGAAQYSTYPDGAVMATGAAIAPLPAMPMSIFLTFQYIVATAASTPAAAARFVTMAIS